jgi:hypothetical protein
VMTASTIASSALSSGMFSRNDLSSLTSLTGSCLR